ncbi:MAG TPA: XRE family transcriptional regulator [Elusimicrobia bacterium]|nr:XRE family transcriptional regulator [Elusimicrobiota bacterium]
MNTGNIIITLRAAKKIADVFGVSLDYFVGEGVNAHFDKKTLQKSRELELLEEDKKKTLFDLMHTYIRDAKTRQAYAAR